LENIILQQYQTAFAKNVSYPAFTNFSLDENYGNGDHTNGDLTGCVNCGWQWSVTSDQATTWVASFSNSQVKSSATVSLTPRNTQLFKPNPGSAFHWFTSNGQKGQVTADQYGLVTVQAVQLATSGRTTLTIQP